MAKRFYVNSTEYIPYSSIINTKSGQIIPTIKINKKEETSTSFSFATISLRSFRLNDLQHNLLHHTSRIAKALEELAIEFPSN